MFKKFLSDNRIFGGIVCVLAFIAGGLLYLQFVQRQASRDIQRAQDILEQRDNLQTGEAEPQTEASGHFHADGTWHTEPHAPTTPNTPPNAVTADTQVSSLDERPNTSKQGAAPVAAPVDVDRIKAAYEALRAKYPEQTNNPHPFENVPVDLQDFEATKEAFMDHLNFYVEHDGGKAEVFNSSREIRIANAVLMNIANAADADVDRTSLVGDDSFLPFTLEQSKEIQSMYRRWRESEGYISPVEKIMAEKGVTRDEAHRISIYERLKSKGWSDEDIPAHYREAINEAK